MSISQYWLASSSPRRQEILSWTGIQFNTLTADVDESTQENELGEKYVERLAAYKARTVVNKVTQNNIIIAADTAVVLADKILGKPADIQEAVSMLRALRDKRHQVITALCVIQPSTGFFVIDRCNSNVQMRKYSDEEINSYIRTGDPLDKAGAYAIQHFQFDPVVNFHGCYACVMGMPLCHLERTLRRLKGYPWRNMPEICQNNLDYTCPIHARVLNGEDIG